MIRRMQAAPRQNAGDLFWSGVLKLSLRRIHGITVNPYDADTTRRTEQNRLGTSPTGMISGGSGSWLRLKSSSDSSKQFIDMLGRLELFRDYERVFSEATGCLWRFGQWSSGSLRITGKNRKPVLRVTCRTSATLAVCLRAHQQMIHHTGELPHTVTCPFGLTETAVPIKLGQRPSATCASARCFVTCRRSPIRLRSAGTGAMESGLRPRFAKHGRKLRYSTRQIQCHRAAARIFCRSTFRVEQPVDDREKQCRAAPCAEGA